MARLGGRRSTCPPGSISSTRAGSPHEFFVILDGEVEVPKDGEHLADLGPGDFFGEIALIEHDRRTASVVTTHPPPRS